MQAINEAITLSESATNLKLLLQEHSQAITDGMYDRGYFYRVGRFHHKSDKLFGQWLTATFVEGVVDDVYIKPDPRTKVFYLMNCNRLLSREQFIRIGYAKATELMVKTVIEKFNEEWLALVEVAHTMTRAQISARMKQIKAGVVSTSTTPTGVRSAEATPPEPATVPDEDDVEIYVSPETSSILDDLEAEETVPF